MNDPSRKSSRFWDWFITAGVMLALLVMFVSIFGPRVGSHGSSLGMQNLNNLHQIGIALTNYATTSHGSLPASRLEGSHASWRLAVAPFLDRHDLFRAYDFDKAWDAPENRKVTGQWVPALKSPFRLKRMDENGNGFTDYGMITGPGTVNPPEGPVTLDYISEHDGLGTTLLVGECSGLQLIWTEPRDPDVSRHTIGIALVDSYRPDSNYLLSTFSEHSVCVLFADGSGRSLNYQMHPDILKAICTVDGGEKIGDHDCR